MSDDSEWVECPQCQGEEGHMDHEADVWVECSTCEGSGGWCR